MTVKRQGIEGDTLAQVAARSRGAILPEALRMERVGTHAATLKQAAPLGLLHINRRVAVERLAAVVVYAHLSVIRFHVVTPDW